MTTASTSMVVVTAATVTISRDDRGDGGINGVDNCNDDGIVDFEDRDDGDGGCDRGEGGIVGGDDRVDGDRVVDQGDGSRLVGDDNIDIDVRGDSGDCDRSAVMTTVMVASLALMTVVNTMVAVTAVTVPLRE